MKINILYFLLLGFLLLSSCDDDLNLLPEQSVDESLAFASVSAARAALNGVYSQAQQIEVFGSQPAIIEDYMADNTTFVGSFPTLQEIRDYITTTPNVSVRELWNVHYRVINGANLVIDNSASIDDPLFDESVSNELIGQAKFLRAITYLQLVNQFAHPYNYENGASLGVPLVLKGFVGTIEFPARSTVAEVHNQIIDDLTDVKSRLSGLEIDNTKANAVAASAYLSRLYLYRGEYQRAADEASLVIGATGVSPATNLDFYNTRNAEWVFVIANSAVDNGATGAGGWAAYHRPASLGGRGDCAMSDDLASLFTAEAGDLRFSNLSDIVVAADQVERRMTTKFPDAANDTDDSPLMRISEVMLTRAEAILRTSGFTQEVLDLVNPLRVRAGLAAWNPGDFGSTEEWIEAVLNERRKELCFEGHRRMDLLRLGRPLRANNTDTELGATRTVLPIPQREIDLNTNLLQNPGY